MAKGRPPHREWLVTLAAGVLGTLGILFRSGLGGPGVGDDVRTNSEVIVGASTPTQVTNAAPCARRQ